MGEINRAIVREEQERVKGMEEQKRLTDRFTSTLVIAAAIIVAVRLAREQDISRPSPRLTSVVKVALGAQRSTKRQADLHAGQMEPTAAPLLVAEPDDTNPIICHSNYRLFNRGHGLARQVFRALTSMKGEFNSQQRPGRD